MTKLIDQGDWGHSNYECYLDLNGSFNDKVALTTGCFCVCINEVGNVVLANNEPLGGHIEQDETVEDALKREALEEGGMKLEKWKYFGYYKVEQKDTGPQLYKNKYPKEAYLLFFLAKGKKVIMPYGTDVKSSQELPIEEAINSKRISHKMLKEGLKLYPKYLE